VILLGLNTEDGAKAIVERAHNLGLKAATARWLTAGSVQSEDVDEWVGLPEVCGSIILDVPDPESGDEAGRWIGPLEGDCWAQSTGLLALRAD
jgi:hypothetical protein